MRGRPRSTTVKGEGRELPSRSFHLSNPPLTPIERVTLEHCREMAAEGKPVTRASINEAIGSRNHLGGTAAGILGRLQDNGYIERRAFHRGVQVCILETGQCTALPTCTVPHWRDIPNRPPSPAIHQVRQRDMTTAQWIEAEARTMGRDMADFLVELVRRGVQDYRADKECPL